MSEKKPLSKKDKTLLIIAGIAFAFALCCQGWYYWPWIRSHVSCYNPYLSSNVNYGSIPSNASCEEYYISNNTNLSSNEVCHFFRDIALKSEFGNHHPTISKWEKTLVIFIDGTPTTEDLSVVQEISDRLNAIPGFPGVIQTNNKEEANIIFGFYDNETFDRLERKKGIRGALGLAWFYLDDAGTEIIHADISIRNTDSRYDEGIYSKTTTIWEEFLQATGLPNDTLLYKETLFYNGEYDVPEATDFDWLVIRILYLPQIKSGMTYFDCLPIIYDYLR